MRYYRLQTGDGPRTVVERGDSAYDLTASNETIGSFFDVAAAADVAGTSVREATENLLEDAPEVSLDDDLAAPVLAEEVWAAGVTYRISEEAREAESGMPEVYLNVYESERPELFLKATPSRTVGPDVDVGIRGDSDWNAPEPELGVVLYRGEVVGYTIGNDVSSRSIEGANPLYLPQAKVYERSCSVGPCVVPAGDIDDPHDLEIAMRVSRDGDVVYDETTSTAKMARTCDELVDYLLKHNAVPRTAVLLTGAALVPEDSFSLEAGDTVEIEIEDIGVLRNTVTRV